jgi:hypothetical protein
MEVVKNTIIGEDLIQGTKGVLEEIIVEEILTEEEEGRSYVMTAINQDT